MWSETDHTLPAFAAKSSHSCARWNNEHRAHRDLPDQVISPACAAIRGSGRTCDPDIHMSRLAEGASTGDLAQHSVMRVVQRAHALLDQRQAERFCI